MGPAPGVLINIKLDPPLVLTSQVYAFTLLATTLKDVVVPAQVVVDEGVFVFVDIAKLVKFIVAVPTVNPDVRIHP